MKPGLLTSKLIMFKKKQNKILKWSELSFRNINLAPSNSQAEETLDNYIIRGASFDHSISELKSNLKTLQILGKKKKITPKPTVKTALS